jgi:hypothetical protein
MFRTAMEINPSPQQSPLSNHGHITGDISQEHQHTKDTKQRLQLLSLEISNIFLTNFLTLLTFKF